jgi:hypothetical protein
MKNYIKLTVLLIITLTTITLTGCLNTRDTINTTTNSQSQNRFYTTGTTYIINCGNYDEVVDRLTGNVYLSELRGYGVNLCPMYDKDGKITNINNK